MLRNLADQMALAPGLQASQSGFFVPGKVRNQTLFDRQNPASAITLRRPVPAAATVRRQSHVQHRRLHPVLRIAHRLRHHPAL
jgi:DNA-directed RNA polymerase beta subunit